MNRSFLVISCLLVGSLSWNSAVAQAGEARVETKAMSQQRPSLREIIQSWFDGNPRGLEYRPVCGNHRVQRGEECDDGNSNNGDGCDSTCLIECVRGTSFFGCISTCGNGVLETGEACDDENIINGDGCSAACVIEEAPVDPLPTCGNDLLEAGEECDDGNAASGDGCSMLCRLEAACGNGILEPGESCDDGNEMSEDGCSAACRIEDDPPADDPPVDDPPLECTDSDGRDPNAAGSASGTYFLGGVGVFADYCFTPGVPGMRSESSYVWEFICSPSGFVVHTGIPCDPGRICREDHCVPDDRPPAAEPVDDVPLLMDASWWCDDSDEGEHPNEWGAASGENPIDGPFIRHDSCVDRTHITEWGCNQDNRPYSREIACDPGKVCSAAAHACISE